MAIFHRDERVLTSTGAVSGGMLPLGEFRDMFRQIQKGSVPWLDLRFRTKRPDLEIAGIDSHPLLRRLGTVLVEHALERKLAPRSIAIDGNVERTNVYIAGRWHFDNDDGSRKRELRATAAAVVARDGVEIDPEVVPLAGTISYKGCDVSSLYRKPLATTSVTLVPSIEKLQEDTAAQGATGEAVVFGYGNLHIRPVLSPLKEDYRRVFISGHLTTGKFTR